MQYLAFVLFSCLYTAVIPKTLSASLLTLIANKLCAPPPLGANLDGVVDYSRSLQFVDVIKTSRFLLLYDKDLTIISTFGSVKTPWDGSAKVDQNGWPLEDFGVVVETNGLTGLGGTYKLSCSGDAPVIKAVASSATVQNWKYDSNTKTTTADLIVPDSDNQLMLTFTNTSGGVKNLKILRPGYSDSDTFTTPFLTQLKIFVGNGVYRFMDWAKTNNNPVVEWSQRAQPTDAQITSARGVPWEYVIQLGNQLEKDIWVNVPHQATDDYVQQFASLLKSKLNPNRKVYVEYSNEVWNWQFQQAKWNLNEAISEVQKGNSPLNYDGSTNQYYWAWRRVALRIKQISDIFAKVWGQSAINDRVIPVLAGQVANPTVIKEGLQMLQAVFGPPSKFVYAIAGAPYFSIGSADKNTTLTAAEVLQHLNASVQSYRTSSALEKHAEMAKNYSLKYFAYEAGVDTFGPNNIAAKKAATLDPRMKQICIDYLNIWFGWGFSNINWFVAGATSWDTQYGTWGLTYDPRILNTTKIQAVEYILQS